MATKAELEAEVDQLKAQLAEQNPDLSAINAELDQLRVDLDKVVHERDYNFDKNKELQAQVDEMTQMAAQDAQKELDLQQQVDSLKQDLKVAQDALAAPSASGCVGDHVSLDGDKYDIIWRSTVKDLSYEGYLKKNVDENQTALVIAKHGG